MSYASPRRTAAVIGIALSCLIANACLGQHVGHAVLDSDAAAVTESVVPCNCSTDKHCPGVCRDPGFPAKPKCEKPGDVDRGDCPPKRYQICDAKRAGNSNKVALWARCNITDKYSAWYTGGGAAFCKGRARKSSEGTWGLDYGGLFGHANVWLKYTRHRQQGGEGAYETDGEPELISRIHGVLHR